MRKQTFLYKETPDLCSFVHGLSTTLARLAGPHADAGDITGAAAGASGWLRSPRLQPEADAVYAFRLAVLGHGYICCHVAPLRCGTRELVVAWAISEV